MYYYGARYYDPRLSIFISVDPLAEQTMTPYQYVNNNPIMLVDPTGMSAEDPTDPPTDGECEQKASTPNVSVRIGGSGGPWGENESTSVFPVLGGKTYYNSTASKRGGNFPKLEEPNSFIQAQFRVGGEDSNYQVGVNWFKEKFRNENDFGFEAPTAFQASFGINNFNVINSGGLSLTTNLSFGVGVELGMPRTDNPAEVINFKPIAMNYGIIGYGGSSIYRLDATYKKFSVFLAATAHIMRTNSVSSNVTTHPSEVIGSLSIRAGVGFNFGK